MVPFLLLFVDEPHEAQSTWPHWWEWSKDLVFDDRSQRALSVGWRCGVRCVAFVGCKLVRLGYYFGGESWHRKEEYDDADKLYCFVILNDDLLLLFSSILFIVFLLCVCLQRNSWCQK